MPREMATAKASQETVALRQKIMPALMPPKASLMPQLATALTLMPHLSPLEMPIAMRVLATVATVATGLGTLGKATPCGPTAEEKRHNEE